MSGIRRIMDAMTVPELHDLLLHIESAMIREGCDGRQTQRVINTLIYGEPDAPDAIYNTAEGRILRRQRALAQAQAHERAMDRLQSELRTAGEAYAYASALAVRDAAMDLVAQLRDDLGEHDLDLIVGEVVQTEPRMDAETYAEVMGALEFVGRQWLDIEFGQLTKPLLFKSKPKPQPDSPDCYDAPFGRVHVRPSCRCPH